RIVEGLRDLGWPVRVHELVGRYPDPDDEALGAVADTLDGVGDGEIAIIDGLCLTAAGPVLKQHAGRIGRVGLVHHPAALETGVPESLARQLAEGERVALAACDQVVATSKTTAVGLNADYDVAPGRLSVVEPGVDPAPLAQGTRDGAPNLLCVGTVTARKGHILLVAALATLTDLPWRLLCAGSEARDPATAAAVQRAVVAAGLEARISFAGELTDSELAAAYADADLLVSASHYEGYGMALTEALARGLPIVATAGGAVAQTVPGDAGIIVPSGDSRVLAAALRVVLGMPDRRQALALGARRVRGTLTSWPQAAARFAAVLESAPW
ncbi:MAG: glycosyltransferase family 4 protein, partial [Alphaproteobacteria bacterium]